MSLDFPAFGRGLWALYDTGGPRPEYLLPVLYYESGFDPSIVNSIGCKGINQACPNAIPTPADYTSWTASEQLAGVVAPMYQRIVARYGPIRSGTRAYQANFLPATLPTAASLSSILAVRGSAVYTANAGFDYRHTGAIRVSDLAHAISTAAASRAVQEAISQTYALRPGEMPHDPVYGEDFSSSPSWLPWVALIAGAGLLAGGMGLIELPRPIRRLVSA